MYNSSHYTAATSTKNNELTYFIGTNCIDFIMLPVFSQVFTHFLSVLHER